MRYVNPLPSCLDNSFCPRYIASFRVFKSYLNAAKFAAIASSLITAAVLALYLVFPNLVGENFMLFSMLCILIMTLAGLFFLVLVPASVYRSLYRSLCTVDASICNALDILEEDDDGAPIIEASKCDCLESSESPTLESNQKDGIDE